jgi:hypothetical protein
MKNPKWLQASPFGYTIDMIDDRGLTDRPTEDTFLGKLLTKYIQ